MNNEVDAGTQSRAEIERLVHPEVSSRRTAPPTNAKPKPTAEDVVREVLGAIPECPRTAGALEELPSEIRERWRAEFIREFSERYKMFPDRHVKELSRYAHYAASKPFRIDPPETIEQARAIANWQLLRRKEMPFNELPEHAQKEIRRSENGRTSGMYLEVFAIDGGQYFFPIPEEKAA